MAPRGLEAGRERRQGPVIQSDAQEQIAESVVGDVFAMQDHELPPELRQERPLFEDDELLRGGMTPQEILNLRRSGHALVEYDHEAEIARLEKLQRQQMTIQDIDAGQRASHDGMAAYFKGGQPLRDSAGKVVTDAHGEEVRCKRYRYVSGEAITVGINGYNFDIPKHKPVMLPGEVIEILENRARALQQYDVLSNIYTTRLNKPISLALDASTINLDPDGGLESFLGRS